MSEIKTISIDNLYIDPQQSRSSKNSRINKEFRDSIERHGVINPLTVREADIEPEKTEDSKGLPEAPAGDQEYYIIAGKRRYEAAVEVGIPEIDCIVKDYTDEEAASVSLEENEHRVPLSQFELAKSVKKRYDILKEDLVGEEEKVECPECGKECEGRQGLKTHIQMKHGGCDESSHPFLSQRQIYDEIAESSSFDWRTVQRLIQVASIPEQFQPFVKIPEERSTQEEDKVSELVSSGFTLANQNRDSTVSQKTIDFARFTQNVSSEIVEKTLKEKIITGKKTSELKTEYDEIEKAWKKWRDSNAEKHVKIRKSVKQEFPQKEEQNDNISSDDTSSENNGEDSTEVAYTEKEPSEGNNNSKEKDSKSTGNVDNATPSSDNSDDYASDDKENGTTDDIPSSNDSFTNSEPTTETDNQKESNSTNIKNNQKEIHLHASASEMNEQSKIEGDFTKHQLKSATKEMIEAGIEYLKEQSEDNE